MRATRSDTPQSAWGRAIRVQGPAIHRFSNNISILAALCNLNIACRFPACAQLTKSFFPYGERHGEESQEGEEDNEKEKEQEVVEPTHSVVRGRHTSHRERSKILLRNERPRTSAGP
jgi:hypothetical protein